MKILVLESDQSLRQLYDHIFNGLGGEWEVLEAGNCVQAIDFLQAHSVDLIVACHELSRSETSIPLLQYLDKANYSAPLLLLSVSLLEDLRLPWFGSRTDHHFFQMPIQLETLAEKVGSLMYSRYESDVGIEHNYIRTKLAYYFRFNRSRCDIYVRLSSTKLVKVISAGDRYGDDDIEKYRRRGIRHLYISNEDYLRWTIGGEQSCGFLYLEESDIDSNELYWRKTHQLLKMLLEEYGISHGAITVANQIVESTIEKAMVSSISQELFKVKNQQLQNYIFDHTYLVAIIGCAILKNLKSVQPKELENFSLFALFHDIGHKSPTLAKLRGIGDRAYADLSFEQKKNFLAIIKESSGLFKSNNYFSRRVKLMAEEYYSLMMSQGPAGRMVMEKLSLLTRVFLIAHDFVNEVIELDFVPDQSDKIIDRLLKRYECGDYVKVVHALVSCHQNYDQGLP